MRRRALVPWIAVGAVFIGLTYRLGGYPLLEPDEGRNAEVAREMAATGAFVLPRLNGLPYLDKPALHFAAGAVAIKALGPTALAARMPSLLFTLATMGIVAWLGFHLFGRAGAWIAAVAYGASPFSVAYARVVIFDPTLTFWTTVALAAFFFATEHRAPPPRYAPVRAAGWWCTVGWAAMALGMLTKGPIALALPLLVMLPYASWRRSARALFDPAGPLTFVALLLPWLLAVSNRVPDFFHYAIVVETVERVLTDTLGRNEPFWYFFPILFGATFPWIVIPLAYAGRIRTPQPFDRRVVFLVLWIAAPLLVFSLSHSKRPQYVLPLVPAVGLLVAAVGAGERRRGLVAAAAAMAAAGAALVVGARAIPRLFETTAAVRAAIPGTAVALGAIALAGSAAALVFRSRHAVAMLALALPLSAIPVVGFPLMRAVAADRSSAAIADALAPVLGDRTDIVAIRTFPLALPFYTQRTFPLATATGAELTSNYVVRHLEPLRRAPGSTLRPADWWRRALALCERPTIFLAAAGDTATRRQLSDLPLRIETRKVAAYGPCGLRDLARRGDGRGE